MPPEPLVSVILPVYNGERFLREALASVHAQDYGTFEVIVVDDGSTDGTAEILRQFPELRCYRQENRGPGAARNRGLTEARGELVAFLDADDLWKPHKLSTQVRHLNDHSAHYVVCKATLLVAAGENIPSSYNPEVYRNAFVAHLPSALLASRSLFTTVGGFAEDIRTGEDTDWFLRAKEMKTPTGCVDEVLLEKRVHDRNMSHNLPVIRENLFRALRSSTGRRHGA